MSFYALKNKPSNKVVLSDYTSALSTCTFSLHDALPICGGRLRFARRTTRYVHHRVVHRLGEWIAADVAHVPAAHGDDGGGVIKEGIGRVDALRSEEDTSELQSPCNLVCRFML